MVWLGSFAEFAKKVVDSAKKGGLGPKDAKKLENLLSRTGKRNTIMAKGILSAMSVGGASPKDVSRFGKIIQNAEAKILNDKKPFTESEKNEINDILKRSFISSKTARWVSNQIDELVAEEINDFLAGARGIEAAVPSRKSISFAKKIAYDEEKKEERRKIRT